MCKKTIAILGGGNGAHTMAADLSMRGYHVRMYEDPAFIGRLGVLRQTLTIRASGLFTGEGKIEFLTDDMKTAIDGADYIAVVTPSTAHVAIAQKLRGLVKKEQTLLIYPGGFGALQMKRVLGEECPVIVQTNNLPYDTRLNGPASVLCTGMSPVSVALFPADADRAVLEDVMDISPYDRIY